MLPIRDDVPSRSFPGMTVALIAANVLMFVFEISLGQRQLIAFLRAFGLVPYRLTAYASGYDLPDVQVFPPFVSSIFLHGGWMHLVGNMWYLWIFGDNVEDRLGHLRFLLFFIVCGVIGNIAHYIFNSTSQVPTIGASGAVAGVLGAYVVSYPNARIVVLVPIFLFIQFIQLPALVVLGFWFVLQFLQGLGSLAAPAISAGVAWWAHIGGFVGGIVVFRLFRPRPRIFYRRGLYDHLQW